MGLIEEISRMRVLMDLQETHVKIMEYDLERKYGVLLDIYESGNHVELRSIEGDYDEVVELKIEQALQSYCKNMGKELVMVYNSGR